MMRRCRHAMKIEIFLICAAAPVLIVARSMKAVGDKNC